MTVSRVLKNNGYASPEVRKKVLRIARQLNYIPDGIARGFVAGRSGNIGFVLCERSLSKPEYYKMLEGVESEIKQRGYRLVFSTSQQYLKNEDSFPRVLNERVVDGLLISGMVDPSMLKILNQRGQKYVLMGGYNFRGVNIVGNNANRIGAEAVGYLAGLGHTQIALVTGRINRSHYLKSLRSGYKSQLMKTGLEFDPNLMIEIDNGDLNSEVLHIVDPDRVPMAIIVANEQRAVEIIHLLQRNGYSVPGDVSVLGIGNYTLARYCKPKLTVIDQQEQLIGKTAVGHLLDLIKGQTNSPFKTNIDIKIVQRESCCCVKNLVSKEA